MTTVEEHVTALESLVLRFETVAKLAAGASTSGVPNDRAAFTVRDVATLLQVAPETVREWFYAGSLAGL